MVERTGRGDPVRVLPLLWQQGLRTGRSGLRLSDVVGTAVALADRTGVTGLSMRKIADELGVGTMTLYAHVPGKGELIDLMVDYVHGALRPTPSEGASDWRAALTGVAETNWELFDRHPWLLDVDTSRPPLGPGTIGKYDAELRALDGTGLDDVVMDQVLSLVLDHVRATARQHRRGSDEPAGGLSETEWWTRSGPLLAAFMDPRTYPHAARVGEAAGQEYGAATDPDRAYAFGLTTILDGVGTLIARSSGPKGVPAP